MIYAVGVKTKQHAIYTKGAPLGSEGFRLVEADADGWIEWRGGECPLPDGALHEVKSASGEAFRSDVPEVDYWGMRHGSARIIAYRPILDTEPAEPRAPEWDGEGKPPVGVLIESRHKDATSDWANPNFQETTIVAMGKHLAIFTHPGSDHETVGRIDEYDFRPIRSEEDEAVHAMRAQDCEPFEGMLSRHDFCRAIYAAIRGGKIPGVKLTGGE